MEWDTLAKECGLKFFIKNNCWWCVTVWIHRKASPSILHNSPGRPETPLCYTKTEKVQNIQYRCEFVGMDVDLIHEYTFVLSLGSLDPTISSFPYMSWTSDPRGASFQNIPNRGNYLKSRMCNWCRTYGHQSIKCYWKNWRSKSWQDLHWQDKIYPK